MNPINQFKEYMRSKGQEPPPEIIPDGKIHRYTVSGDKARSDNGWYVFHDGDITAGAFGCWKRQISEAWSSREYRSLTNDEKDRHRAILETVKKEREAEQERRRTECREWCKDAWAKADIAPAGHPYLLRKGIKPHGIKQIKDCLIVPVMSLSGVIHGMQFISADGSKQFKAGSNIRGTFYLIGAGKHSIAVICEGFATGASIHEATGYDVYVAFNAGNLGCVANDLKCAFQKKHFIIAADNDQWTDGNTGLTKGREVATAIGAELVYPIFSDTTSKPTDFNDLHNLEGIGTVLSQFQNPIKSILSIKSTGDEWPEPILFGEIETPELPTDLLPEPVAGYCKAVSESTQTPVGMAVMMALAAVATCLQKRFEVSPFGDNYTEPVNLMAVTALDPANRKSAVLKAMTEPLTLWETQEADSLREEIIRVRHQRDMLSKSIDSIKSSASKPDATDEKRCDALAEIRRLESTMPPEVLAPRLWIDDVTPERLQNLMAENGERISIISAEGGVFEVIAGLYSGGKSNINVILQSHSGEPVRVERQGRSVTMLKPALTFGLCVQPDIISKLASGSKSRFRGNGMLARLLYCIPKSTVGSRDVTKRKPVPEKVKHEYHALIYRLLAIAPLVNEQGVEQARVLTLAPDALEAWLQFSQYIESKQGQHGEFHSIQDWTGKLPGASLRIAGLCHVVEHGEATTVISKATVEKALDLAELLIAHAKAAFASMGSDPAIPDAKVVFQWILKNGNESFRRSESHTALHGTFERVYQLIAALKVLTERHIISGPQELKTGRRPSIVYTVNPEIIKGGNRGMA